MKLLVDMNLSPDWVPRLRARGWEAVHWSRVGAANAPDSELLAWARTHDYIIITQDLDFPQLLFASASEGPSSVVLRMDNEFDAESQEHVFRALEQAADALKAGAILTISGHRIRIRRLPV